MNEYTGVNDVYKVDYDGRTYEFENWSEMKQFIEEHEIHG